MRPFEIIFLLSLFVLILRIAFPGQKSNVIPSLLILSIILLIIHVFTESFRWQMMPAYLTLALLYLRFKTGELAITRNINRFLWAIWLGFIALLPYVVPVIHLPDPSGPYKIGTVITDWTDTSRTEWFTPENEDDFRHLVVQIWYPVKNTVGDPIPYIDHLSVRQKAIGAAGGFPGFLIGHLDLVQTHSYPNTKIIEGKHPLLLFSHGITGFRQLHTALVEDLVSHGYIVAVPDHTYDCNLTVFPNKTIADYRSEITGHPDSVAIRRMQLNTRVDDIRFIVNTLLSDAIWTNAIDTSSVGVIGHSYGGATAIQSGIEDSRIKAVLSLDSWMNPLPTSIIQKGIHKPFLYFGRPNWNDSDYPSSPDLLKIFLKNSGANSYYCILQNSRHLDFSDAPLFSPLAKMVLETGSIKGSVAVGLTRSVVRMFFDNSLIKSGENLFEELLYDPSLEWIQ